MKRIFLTLLLPFFIQCYGMNDQLALPDECYKKYANDLLKSFEKFGPKETYRADIEKYMRDTIQDCSSMDKNILKAATILMDPDLMKQQIPKPDRTDEWICVIFAEQMQKLFNHTLPQELSTQIKSSAENYKQKLNQYSSKEKMFYLRLTVARNYANTILTILNAK